MNINDWQFQNKGDIFWECHTHLSLSFPLVGLAGSGPSSSYRAAERGAGAALVHREQCRRENPCCGQVQAQRGPKGHPSRHVWPEIIQSRAPCVPAGHPGAWGAGRGVRYLYALYLGIIFHYIFWHWHIECPYWLVSRCGSCASAEWLKFSLVPLLCPCFFRRRTKFQMMKLWIRWSQGVKRSLITLWFAFLLHIQKVLIACSSNQF